MKTAFLRTLLALAVVSAVAVAPVLAQSMGAGMVKDKYKGGIEQLRGGNLDSAISMFREALSSGEGMAGAMEAMGQTRYALAYALVQQDNVMEAIPLLEKLVSDNPNHVNARFLLGVALGRSITQSQRGMEVLQQMAKESEGDQKEAATRTAARLGYNVATTFAAGGNAGGALAMMGGVTTELNSAPAADDDENAAIRYSMAKYLADTGDYDGAIFELEFLLVAGGKSKYKDFALKNGVAGKQVLANIYYQAALKDLDSGTSGADSALDRMKEVAKLEGKAAVDVLHVQAVAHEYKGDKEASAKDLEDIKGMDSGYHSRITGS